MPKPLPEVRSVPQRDDRPFVGPGTVHPLLREAPGPLARRFAQIIDGSLIEPMRTSDLNRLEYGVLIYASTEPGIDQSRVAAMNSNDPTSVGLAVDELEKRNLIVRLMADHDRRVRLVYLTPKGEKLLKDTRPLVQKANRSVLG